MNNWLEYILDHFDNLYFRTYCHKQILPNHFQTLSIHQTFLLQLLLLKQSQQTTLKGYPTVDINRKKIALPVTLIFMIPLKCFISALYCCLFEYYLSTTPDYYPCIVELKFMRSK